MADERRGAAQRDLSWPDGMLYFRGDGTPLSPEARALYGLAPIVLAPGQRWVELLDERLDHRSLVEAYLTAAALSDLGRAGAYWRRRVALLEELLGVSLSAAQEAPRAPVARDLGFAAQGCLRLCGSVRLSFPEDRYLEGGPAPEVRTLCRPYQERFARIEDELRHLCRGMLVEIVEALAPEIVGKTVLKSQLFDLGLEWWEPDATLERVGL